MSSVAGIAVFALAAAMTVMVVTDLRSRRIPNAIILIGMLVAFAVHTFALAIAVPPLAGLDWWSPLAGIATGFALMLPLHLLRAMGAGDVKLMAMVGAFIGPGAVATAVLYTLLAGGLLSLVFMFGRGVAAQTFANIRFMLTDRAVRAASGQGSSLPPLQTTAARLPYALAIALGTAAALIWPLGSP
jgi:prepilin peptidase CpaA